MTKTVTTVEDEDDVEVAEKTYHSQFRGSTFIQPNGVINSFNAKGELRTTSKLLQRDLDAIADKPGSTIWTKQYTPAPNEDKPVNEIQTKAAETVAALEQAKAANIKA